MSVVKTHRFRASVHWCGGRLTNADATGKPRLDVATPPEFRGGVEGVWSPEELLVASAGSCLALTLAAVAEASGVKLESIDVDGLGQVERGPHGPFQFVAIELALEVAADEPASSLERLVREAERRCIVALALAVPIHVRLRIAATAPSG